MVPPLRLFTVVAPVAWRALPIGPVAWILPPFVTLTVFPKMAMPSARMVPPLRLFTVEFPAIARPADSVASMSPEFPVSSIVGANIPAEPPVDRCRDLAGVGDLTMLAWMSRKAPDMTLTAIRDRGFDVGVDSNAAHALGFDDTGVIDNIDGIGEDSATVRHCSPG